MKHLLTAFLLVIISAASGQNIAVDTTKFHLPVIVQKGRPSETCYTNRDSMDETEFIYGGKYSFTDTLYLDFAKDSIDLVTLSEDIKDVVTEDDTFWETIADTLNETNNIATGGSSTIIMYPTSNDTNLVFPSNWSLIDTLPMDGLQMFVDEKAIITLPLFAGNKVMTPVYLVNETHSVKYAYSALLGIQEAKDDRGIWRPVEYYPAFGWRCGFGIHLIKLYPGEFIMFYVLKYDGNYHASMRVRLRNYYTTYVSSSFAGSINYTQFLLPKGLLEQPYMKLKRSENLDGFFFGAMPWEADDH